MKTLGSLACLLGLALLAPSQTSSWGVQPPLTLTDNGDNTTTAALVPGGYDINQMTGVALQIFYFDIPKPSIPNDHHITMSIPLGLGTSVVVPVAKQQIRSVGVIAYKDVGYHVTDADGHPMY